MTPPPPPAAPDPLAELKRAKSAFDDPTTDRDTALHNLATAAIRAYHGLSSLREEVERLKEAGNAIVPHLRHLASRCCYDLDSMGPGNDLKVAYDAFVAALSPSVETGEGKTG